MGQHQSLLRRFILSSLLLAGVLGALLLYTGWTSREPPVPAGITADVIEQTLVPGMTREVAEQYLRSWKVNFGFVPREKMRQGITADYPTPPGAVGALGGGTSLLDRIGSMERFILVVVYLDADNKVIRARAKQLSVGP